MANYAELIKAQVTIGEDIAKKRTNFKKESKDRLNDIEYVKRWYKRLNNVWAEFVQGHRELARHAEELKDQPYFNKNYYKQVNDTYNDVKKTIVALEVMRNYQASTSNEEVQNGQGAPEAGAPVPNTPAREVMAPGTVEQATEDQSATEPGTPAARTPAPRTPARRTREPDAVTPGAAAPVILENEGNSRSDNDIEIINDEQEGFSDYIENRDKLKTKALENVQRFNAITKFYEKQLNTVEQYINANMTDYAATILKENEDFFKEIREQLSLMMFITKDATLQEQYEDTFEMLQHRKIQLSRAIKDNTAEKGENVIPIKPIEIPNFSGSIQKWPTFCELFRAMIIENKKLSQIQRMQYLKTTVSGEAAQLIASLEITGSFEKA